MIIDTRALDYQYGPAVIHLPSPDLDSLAAAVVALANTDGGVIVTGPDDPAAVDALLREALGCFQPTLALDSPQPVSTAQGPALAIQVPRSRRVHALSDGQALIHTANGLRALSGNEIRALVGMRHHGDFEAEVVPGARIADLDRNVLTGFMLAHTQSAFPNSRETDLPLVEIGAITPDQEVTVAGLLLFGRDPQAWLSQSRARVVSYAAQTADNGLPPVYDRVVRGPLVYLIEQLWRLITEQIPGQKSAVPLPLYSAGAVRAALINAVCHRDYRLRGEGITVAIFPDALEITSPGGLPGFITHPGDILGHHYHRNPRLCWALAQWGYGQNPTPGMKQIMGTHHAEISARPYSVTIRFDADRTASSSPGGTAGLLSDCQLAAVDYAQAHGSITLRELQTLCGGIAPRVLQAELDALATAGRLRRIGKAGSRSGTYYILP
ncbi:MAG: hypothetical protein HY866_13765 [Chloroflexi bacterium]|nr:hypothetical protein [Chloroflexota bacterium]